METVVYAVWYVLHADADVFQAYHTALTTVSLRINLRISKHAGENKLNINLENYAFLWMVLYNYNKMHGAET